MKSYIGTKQINAKPMNRQEYNDFRGWTLPADENGADEGYLVEYVGPGQKPNTPEYAGYVSWSPKDVFEEAYKPSDTFYDRLIIERDELGGKLKKLSQFVISEQFKNIPDEDQSLLRKQGDAMSDYFNALDKRIEVIERRTANA